MFDPKTVPKSINNQSTNQINTATTKVQTCSTSMCFCIQPNSTSQGRLQGRKSLGSRNLARGSRDQEYAWHGGPGRFWLCWARSWMATGTKGTFDRPKFPVDRCHSRRIKTKCNDRVTTNNTMGNKGALIAHFPVWLGKPRYVNLNPQGPRVPLKKNVQRRRDFFC